MSEEIIELERAELNAVETARLNRLCEIFWGELYGEVDGVFFDLRHELLRFPEWTSPMMGQSAVGTLTDPDLPLIWFPWFGNLQIDSGWPWSSTLEAAKDRTNYETQKKPARSFGSKRAECIVEVGDKLKIDRVERNRIGTDFDHLHDAEIRFAYLIAIKPNGNCKRLSTPLIFRGNKSLTATVFTFNYVNHIMDRIFSYMKISSIKQFKRIKKDNSYAYKALEQANKYIKARDDAKNDPQFSDTAYVANEAVLLGYLWAKAEAEVNIKPLANRLSQIETNNKKGGKKSGVARRKLAQDGWQKIAKQLAFENRAKQPTLSQDRLVVAINKAWEGKKPVAPQFPTLKKYISYLEKNEGLPAKPRKTSKAPTLVAAE